MKYTNDDYFVIHNSGMNDSLLSFKNLIFIEFEGPNIDYRVRLKLTNIGSVFDSQYKKLAWLAAFSCCIIVSNMSILFFWQIHPPY